jgi:integrase
VRGSVVKKGERWYVVIEDKDPATGRRKRRWHSGYRTKREAQAACNELATSMQRGEYLTPNKQTVGEFCEEWLLTIRATVRPSTLDKYERDLRSNVVPYIGFVPLSKLDGSALNRLWATLAESGRKASRPGAERGGLAPKSIENIAMTLHRVLKDAVRWGRISRNPADMADAPKRSATHREIQAWNVETLRTFLEVTRDDDLFALWLFLATSGVRRGEALGLRWADVDLDTARARITQTVITISWKVHFGQPKTAAGRRPIALDPMTVGVMREHRKRMLERRLLVGDGFVDQGLVFCQPDGAPLHPERVYQAFQRALKKHDLPTISIHGLRHTWATIALEQGVHPRVVQERLGHANIAVTLQTYSHVLPTMHDDAAATVASLLAYGRGASRGSVDPATPWTALATRQNDEWR